jgi:hypothetical protein
MHLRVSGQYFGLIRSQTGLPHTRIASVALMAATIFAAAMFAT